CIVQVVCYLKVYIHHGVCSLPKSVFFRIITHSCTQPNPCFSAIMLSPAISALQSDVVHKICSGQVVVTLASAVKELVENSIDSGATKIDVRLREYGSELIEVSDNGSGIKEQDFDAITGKHSTSKIREFDDLHSVRTFGFRGEALSSLCQLSNLVIHTCAIDASVGTRLEFDSQGIIVTRRPLARSHGTTVFVHQLFHNLPVRRRHLTDPGRLTKEFAKAVSLLTAYCLSTVGVQISCSRITKSSEKIHVVSNGSATSIKDNLAAVYGQHLVSVPYFSPVNAQPQCNVQLKFQLTFPIVRFFSVRSFS
ncbi:hypothetical protein P879_11318, partial [Paragonimus westermani]